MISRSFLFAVAASVLLVAPPGSARAQAVPQAASAAAVKPLPFLSPIFGDNMVMQRGKADTLWVWSEPGDTIRVRIGDKTASAVAGADRRWEVEIQPPPAGGPYTIRVSGRETIELHNVLVGDVWLAPGQSNMEFEMRRAATAASARSTRMASAAVPDNVSPKNP